MHKILVTLVELTGHLSKGKSNSFLLAFQLGYIEIMIQGSQSLCPFGGKNKEEEEEEEHKIYSGEQDIEK